MGKLEREGALPLLVPSRRWTFPEDLLPRTASSGQGSQSPSIDTNYAARHSSPGCIYMPLLLTGRMDENTTRTPQILHLHSQKPVVTAEHSQYFCLLPLFACETGNISIKITWTVLFFNSLSKSLKTSIICKIPCDAVLLVPRCITTGRARPDDFIISPNLAETSHIFTPGRQPTNLLSSCLC